MIFASWNVHPGHSSLAKDTTSHSLVLETPERSCHRHPVDCGTDHSMVRTRLNIQALHTATNMEKTKCCISLQQAKRGIELKRTLEHNLTAPTFDEEIRTATLTKKIAKGSRNNKQ